MVSSLLPLLAPLLVAPLVLPEQLRAHIVTEEVAGKVVKTKYGRVQGFLSKVGRDAATSDWVQVFLGIPYASPPTGNYRFAPTRPPTHWPGVFSATQHGAVCPQVFPETQNSTAALMSMSRRRLNYLRETRTRLTRQAEDCLNLNIYLPQRPPEEGGQLLPVIVFIHGESYMWGSGNLHDGRVLASRGRLVVVTLNYRLGILGFLNTNTAPHQHPQMANYGLMDQIAALKWIQQNIAQFGGDPELVTMFGYRQGAACIHFLMQSPAAVAGLFHRAILMSGTSFSSWSLVEDPVHYAVKVASALNCSLPTNMMKNHQELVKCLREKPLSDLHSVELKAPSFLTAMGPSRDGVLIPSDFGTSSFHIHRKRSTAPSYKIIVGFSDSETEELFSEEQLERGISAHEQKRLLRTLVRNSYMHHLNEIFYTVENEYAPLTGAGAPLTVRRRVAEALGDKLYISPALETASWCNESGYSVHLYLHSRAREEAGQEELSILPLVFGLPFAPEISGADFQASPRQALVAQAVITHWANFAYSGDPNSPLSVGEVFPGSSHREGEHWQEYNKAQANYFLLGLSPHNAAHYRQHAMSLWLRLVPQLHLSGAEHSYPQHNIFHGHSAANSRSGQRVLGNRAFQSQQLTTPRPPCLGQEAVHSYHGVHNATLVKIEEASTAAYNKAIYLILLIGFLMLCGNVWFWLCFVIRRQGHSCCPPLAHSVTKDSSCETELVASHSSNSSLQNMKSYSLYQTQDYKPDYKPGSDGLLRKRSHASDTSYSHSVSEGHSISFISSNTGRDMQGRSTVELVPCLKRGSRSREEELAHHTLPRQHREERAGREQEARSAGRELLARSSSQEEGGASRPYMSTFCHVIPPPLPEPKFLQPESV